MSKKIKQLTKSIIEDRTSRELNNKIFLEPKLKRERQILNNHRFQTREQKISNDIFLRAMQSSRVYSEVYNVRICKTRRLLDKALSEISRYRATIKSFKLENKLPTVLIDMIGKFLDI